MTSTSSRVFRWSELAQVPDEPGIYAWYYVVGLTNFDLDHTIKEIDSRRETESAAAAKEVLKTFLDEFVFRYFAEEPYVASIRGPLKPNYEGRLEHIPEISRSLLERIIEKPGRLRTLRAVLESAVPNFASPIYIGMASRLMSRVLRHKNLIEKLRGGATLGASAQEDQRDQSFAVRVVERNLSPDSLRLAVTVIQSAESQYVDAENVLNRINFPILGRN